MELVLFGDKRESGDLSVDRQEIRSCTRSCKPFMLVATSATVRQPADGKAATNWGKPEDLPFKNNIKGFRD